MRYVLAACFLAITSAGYAQTVVSAQNGPWLSPSTWDCACVPDFSQNVVIMHSVEINSALLLGHQQVQVTSVGEITMSFPETVSFNTVLINEGHVLVMGDILNQGLFNNAGFAEFIGTVLNDGSIISNAGAVMQIEGDFLNQDLLQGEGAVCVTDQTDNQGTISGTIDLCDWTPTVNMPPFIDLNSGTVESGVTFCQNSPCASGVHEAFGLGIGASPSLAQDEVVLTGLPPGVAVVLMDAVGRVALPARMAVSDRMELALSSLPAGAFRVVVRGAAGQRVLPFVIAR